MDSKYIAFWLKLTGVKLTGNKVLKLLMRIITPDIIKSFTSGYSAKENRTQDILKEHREIVNQIIAKNAIGAKAAMSNHLNRLSA